MYFLFILLFLLTKFATKRGQVWNVICIKFLMKEIREFKAPKNHYQSSDIIYSELYETYLSFLNHSALRKYVDLPERVPNTRIWLFLEKYAYYQNFHSMAHLCAYLSFLIRTYKKIQPSLSQRWPGKLVSLIE